MVMQRQMDMSEDFKCSLQSTYLQLPIGRRVQIILLKVEKAELLTFYSWGRFITPCFQWITVLRFTFIYPLHLRRPQCLQAVSAPGIHLWGFCSLFTRFCWQQGISVQIPSRGEDLWEAWALLQKQGVVLLPALSGMWGWASKLKSKFPKGSVNSSDCYCYTFIILLLYFYCQVILNESRRLQKT